MKRVNVILAVFAVIPSSMIISGCGATDWATREIPDGSSLDEGEVITVLQKDGVTRSGIYKGTASLSSSEYADEYSRVAAQTFDGKSLPEIGQNIRILTSLSEFKVWEGELIGFDCGSLWMKPNNSAEPEEVYFTSLRCMSAKDNKVFHRMHLRNLFMNGDIPIMAAVEVENISGVHSIPISLIDRIELYESGSTFSANDLFFKRR